MIIARGMPTQQLHSIAGLPRLMTWTSDSVCQHWAGTHTSLAAVGAILAGFGTHAVCLGSAVGMATVADQDAGLDGEDAWA